MKAVTPLNVLIVGAGMYTCGIGTEGFGTILPTVYEGYKQGLVNKVTIAATNSHKRNDVLEKSRLLGQAMGLDVNVDYFPNDDQSYPYAYQELAGTSDYDCAIVSIPDHLHFDVTKNLIKNKLHCLVVKPLVPHLQQVDELIALQRENNVYCAVEFHKRFDETNQRTLKMLREKSIGDLLYILVEYSQRRSIPLQHFRGWSDQTNIFQYLGVHYVDLIYYCTGALPQRVMALGQKEFLREAGLDAYDSIQGIIEWGYADTDKKFTSTILTNWVDPLITTAMSEQRIKYIGTQGRIECDQKERGMKVISDQRGVEDINPYFSDFRYDIQNDTLNFRGYGYESIFQFLKDCHGLKNDKCQTADLKGLRATFQESRVSTAVIEAVNSSLENRGEWVDVDLGSSTINKGSGL
jgi:predicted dehydrogenase